MRKEEREEEDRTEKGRGEEAEGQGRGGDCIGERGGRKLGLLALLNIPRGKTSYQVFYLGSPCPWPPNSMGCGT